MTSIFKPKVAPQQQEVAAIPQADDEEIRRAKAKKIAEIEKSSGASGNQLTESKLGDYSQAQVRAGAAPKSTVISGA